MAAMSASETTRAGASTSVSPTTRDYEVLIEEGGVERTRPPQGALVADDTEAATLEA